MICVFQPIYCCAQFLPNTEVGDGITRPLDNFSLFPYASPSIGHIGVMGLWQGNNASDPSDYYEYDVQFFPSSTTWAGPLQPFKYNNATIEKRTFKNFTTINTIMGLSYPAYGGGWQLGAGVFSPAGPAMSPNLRNTIVQNAESVTGTDLSITYYFLPFTELPAVPAFRCDGFVDYIMELSGVGNGQGAWPTYLKTFIPGAITYAEFGGKSESGTPPTISMADTSGNPILSGQATSSTTVVITATKQATGSSLYSIVLTGPTSSSQTFTSGTLTGSLTASALADGSYSVTTYDAAGNHTSQSFIVGGAQFLVESRA